MKGFKTKTEQDMAASLLSSQKTLLESERLNGKREALRNAYSSFRTVFLIDAFYDQDVSWFDYLLDGEIVATLEGSAREELSSCQRWTVSLKSLREYMHKRNLLKQQRILIGVARQLATEALRDETDEPRSTSG